MSERDFLYLCVVFLVLFCIYWIRCYVRLSSHISEYRRLVFGQREQIERLEGKLLSCNEEQPKNVSEWLKENVSTVKGFKGVLLCAIAEYNEAHKDTPLRSIHVTPKALSGSFDVEILC